MGTTMGTTRHFAASGSENGEEKACRLHAAGNKSSNWARKVAIVAVLAEDSSVAVATAPESLRVPKILSGDYVGGSPATARVHTFLSNSITSFLTALVAHDFLLLVDIRLSNHWQQCRIQLRPPASRCLLASCYSEYTPPQSFALSSS